MMQTLDLKFLLMGVIFLSTTLVGISPILFRGVCGDRISVWLSAPQRARLLSCASCFSAGVFLFVCFMGLLPAADNKFHHILKRLAEEDPNLEAFSEFPWGFFVVTCGFLVIFTIDKLVHAFEVKRQHGDDHSDDGSSTSSSSTDSPASDVTLLSIKGSNTPINLIDPSLGGTQQQDQLKSSPTIKEYVANSLKEKQEQQQQQQQNGSILNNTRTYSAAATEARGCKGDKEKPLELHLELQQKEGRVLASDGCIILERAPQHTGHGVPSSLIFLMALGIHSLFEGAAVGLQTEREKVLEFGVAVLVHEVVMAFTFGLEVSRSRRLTWVWQMLYVGMFTISIPLGIAVGAGTLTTTNPKNREIVAAVMEAIATGIFLHVIFIEILAKEFPDHHNHEDHHNYNQKQKPSMHGHRQQQPDYQRQQPTNYHTIRATDTDDEGLTKLTMKGAAVTITAAAASTQPEAASSKAEAENTTNSSNSSSRRPSEVRLILEKILCICAGLLTLILLNVFMHSHH